MPEGTIVVHLYVDWTKSARERRYALKQESRYRSEDLEILRLNPLGSYNVPLSRLESVESAILTHRGREDSLARKIRKILSEKQPDNLESEQ